MKKISLLLALSFLISGSFAQETESKTREISLAFYNFDNYGLMYKKGKTPDKLWRFRFLAGGFSTSIFSSTSASNSFSTNFSFAVGRERRKEIGTKLTMLYGVELMSEFFYNYSKSNSSSANQNLWGTAGIVGVFGFNYHVTSQVSVGIELLPSVRYSRLLTNRGNAGGLNYLQDAISFGFGSQSGLLTVGIRF